MISSSVDTPPNLTGGQLVSCRPEDGLVGSWSEKGVLGYSDYTGGTFTFSVWNYS